MDDWHWCVMFIFHSSSTNVLDHIACMFFTFSHGLSGLMLTTCSAEHHVLYQYNLVNARNHWMGMIQTETVSLTVVNSSVRYAERRSVL